jgi:hypothetical protein
MKEVVMWTGCHNKDKMKITEMIIIGIILLSIVLLPLWATKLPQGTQQIEFSNIGLPEKVIEDLRNLLNP